MLVTDEYLAAIAFSHNLHNIVCQSHGPTAVYIFDNSLLIKLDWQHSPVNPWRVPEPFFGHQHLVHLLYCLSAVCCIQHRPGWTAGHSKHCSTCLQYSRQYSLITCKSGPASSTSLVQYVAGTATVTATSKRLCSAAALQRPILVSSTWVPSEMQFHLRRDLCNQPSMHTPLD